ncbi:unnamed protein product, partial [Amoebophrya sp. A25]
KQRTVRKSETGVVYRCRVKLGVTKNVSAVDKSLTFRKLYDEGYDSVLTTVCPNPEYAVYNSDQVELIGEGETFQGRHD